MVTREQTSAYVIKRSCSDEGVIISFGVNVLPAVTTEWVRTYVCWCVMHAPLHSYIFVHAGLYMHIRVYIYVYIHTCSLAMTVCHRHQNNWTFRQSKNTCSRKLSSISVFPETKIWRATVEKNILAKGYATMPWLYKHKTQSVSSMIKPAQVHGS